MNIPRRHLVNFLAGALVIAVAGTASAQSDWPAKSVRLVSPYGAGGSNDISARILAEELQRRLGQQFIVENKPGAGTRLANDSVARATPDGYTFLLRRCPLRNR